MKNQQQYSIDRVQEINTEIAKTKKPDLNANIYDLMTPQTIDDLENNESLTLKRRSKSVSSNSNHFFYKDKTDGQYKVIDQSNETSNQIPSSEFSSNSNFRATVNEVSQTASTDFQKNSMNPLKSSYLTDQNSFQSNNMAPTSLSIPIASDIDDKTISEGLSIFWILSNQIEKYKVKKDFKKNVSQEKTKSHHSKQEQIKQPIQPQIQIKDQSNQQIQNFYQNQTSQNYFQTTNQQNYVQPQTTSQQNLNFQSQVQNNHQSQQSNQPKKNTPNQKSYPVQPVFQSNPPVSHQASQPQVIPQQNTISQFNQITQPNLISPQILPQPSSVPPTSLISQTNMTAQPKQKQNFLSKSAKSKTQKNSISQNIILPPQIQQNISLNHQPNLNYQSQSQVQTNSNEPNHLLYHSQSQQNIGFNLNLPQNMIYNSQPQNQILQNSQSQFQNNSNPIIQPILQTSNQNRQPSLQNTQSQPQFQNNVLTLAQFQNNSQSQSHYQNNSQFQFQNNSQHQSKYSNNSQIQNQQQIQNNSNFQNINNYSISQPQYRNVSNQQKQINQNPQTQPNLQLINQSKSQKLQTKEKKRTQQKHQPEKSKINHFGCVKVLKKMPSKAKDTNNDSKEDQKESVNYEMPPIPTSGVYSRVQKAHRHVMKVIDYDFIFEQDKTVLNTHSLIQNPSQNLVPIIPISLFQKKDDI